MSRDIPPTGARSIPHDFLAELDRASHLPINGPGVSQTDFGTFILPPPPSAGSLTAFELKTSLTPGGTATAWSLAWDSATGDFTNPTYTNPTDLTVTDPFSLFMAPGYNDLLSGGFRGFCNADGVIVYLDTAQVGKLAGTLAQGGSASVTIWVGGSATTMTVTAYDWLMKTGATAIASGKKVVLQVIGGTVYVTEAECP